jgi:hypothetical protein
MAFAEMEPGKDVFADVKVTADSGFHSKTALAAVEATRSGEKSTVAGWAPSNRSLPTSRTRACDDSRSVVRGK